MFASSPNSFELSATSVTPLHQLGSHLVCPHSPLPLGRHGLVLPLALTSPLVSLIAMLAVARAFLERFSTVLGIYVRNFVFFLNKITKNNQYSHMFVETRVRIKIRRSKMFGVCMDWYHIGGTFVTKLMQPY